MSFVVLCLQYSYSIQYAINSERCSQIYFEFYEFEKGDGFGVLFILTLTLGPVKDCCSFS